LVAAVAAIIGALLAGCDQRWLWLHWMAKPLATGLLLVLALRTSWPLSGRYRNRICAGLAFALAGDVLLMLPIDLFVPGLLAFLLTQLCFLAAWLDDSRFAVRPLAWLGCLAAALVLLALLWPGLIGVLRVAVVAYAATLATMTGQALGRARWHAAVGDVLARPARWAALGALAFMLSDSLLAWDRFRQSLPLAPLWILGTYYPALWAIARSVEREPCVRGSIA
jgi:uncharacterized membrane protein YhhN